MDYYISIFQMQECPYISDTSIQILAQHCLDIDYIDLSRNEMQYRISDISMLALGQKSHSLRTLKLNGCDCITDVGLNWLTEGCKALEEIDLSNCNKVSTVLYYLHANIPFENLIEYCLLYSVYTIFIFII